MSAKNKYSNLKDFLIKHKTIPEKPFTHTALGQPPDSYPGSYCIDDDELDIFYKLYSKNVFEKGGDVHLTERHKDVSPILIDLDLRHKADNNKRIYTKNFIKNFVALYISELKKIIPDIKDDLCKAYILEKDNPIIPSNKNIKKDGIHIIFPYIVSEPKLQYIIRYSMITNDAVKSLIDTISVTNPLDDIFDIAVIERNNWQMYGSFKPDNIPYKLTHVLEPIDDDIREIKNNKSDSDILKLLSIRSFNKKYILDTTKFNDNINQLYDSIPKNQQVKKRKKIVNKKKKSPAKKNFLDSQEDLDFVKDIVKILDPKRADSYDLWIRLGWCLHNIDYRLLQSWTDFSKKSYKFVDGECENEWPLMDNEGLGLGSLYLWAKEDNFEKYQELCRTNLRRVMLDSLSVEPNDIARVVHHLYKHEFVCFSSRKNVWFQFKNHRWNEIDDAIELRLRLSNEIVNEYYKLNSYVSTKCAQLSGVEKELWSSKLAVITKIISSLKRTSFKKNIIQECNEMFHDSKFEEKLDTNVNLIGFENGIFDLNEHKFRDGLPEDYVRFSTKTNYVEFDDDDEDIVGVKKFLSEVLPKDNIREYVTTLLSTFLSGKTSSEKFHIWTGCGGNGKSKLIELFEYAFGEYCCKLPVNLLTEKRARAEGATPSLVRTKGKRFACLQEPDKHEEIQVGLMKELTGGDKIIARGLHKEPIEFKPQFKMVLTCNDLPVISANDRGTWRRISVVEFISKFVDEPDPNEKYEFKIDDNLEEKLKIWPEAFMYILIQYYKKYKKNGIKEPEEVKKAHDEYQSESDYFVQFINDKLVVLENCDSKGIKLEDIYFVFKQWFSHTMGYSGKCPTKKDLKSSLTKKFGSKSSSDNKIYG